MHATALADLSLVPEPKSGMYGLRSPAPCAVRSPTVRGVAPDAGSRLCLIYDGSRFRTCAKSTAVAIEPQLNSALVKLSMDTVRSSIQILFRRLLRSFWRTHSPRVESKVWRRPCVLHRFLQHPSLQSVCQHPAARPKQRLFRHCNSFKRTNPWRNLSATSGTVYAGATFAAVVGVGAVLDSAGV
jgi:hypothetical protein